MTWTQPPAPRADLVFEDLVALDGSGGFTAPWIDSGGVYRLRVAVFFLNNVAGTVGVQESAYDGTSGAAGSTPRLVREQPVTVSSFTGYAELDITCRWFNVIIRGGDPADFASITVRKVAI